MKTAEFTKKYYVKRENTLSVKWEAVKDTKNLPMWIADMDFKTDERLINALKKHIEHGAYGYSIMPKDYAEVYIAWQKKRHNITYKKEWLRFTKGAVNGLKQCIQSLTKVNDAVLITSPVYHPFSVSIKDTHRKLVESYLIVDNNYFYFDFNDLEKKFKKHKVKMMVLCNPHNPGGRVWKKGELEELFALCKKHHVIVVSDEVHSDIIMPDQTFTPALSLKQYNDITITLNTMSKSLNLAAFAHSHVLIPNKKYRDKFDKFQKENFLDTPIAYNTLPAYYGMKYSESWVNDSIEVIFENYQYFKERLGKYIDIMPLEGTYLVFANFKKYTKNGKEFLEKKCHILTNPGESFGKGYDTWARFNIGTSKANIKKACDAIIKEIKGK